MTKPYDATNIEFSLDDERELKALAILTAQWVREGVTFSLKKDSVAIEAKLTGGF